MHDATDIIDKIYSAPFAPHLWQEVLDDFSKIADAKGGVIVSLPSTSGYYIYSDAISRVCEQMIDVKYTRHNPLGDTLLRLPSASFHSDTDHFTEEDKARMVLFTDLYWPNGIGNAVATHMRAPTGEVFALTMLREREKGAPRPGLIDELTAIRPHLGRALTLAARNEFQQIQNANHALGVTGLASAAITATGKIIDCNALFTSLPEQIVVAGRDRLRLVHARANAILDECLALARLPTGSPPSSSRSVALPATDATGPAVMHLVPAHGIVRDLFTNVAFFIIITPVDAVRPAPLAIIEGLFDLTVSEARIAQALSTGQDVKEMATAFGISTETVRRHLKNIFSKTGISRQAELSAVIASLKVI